MALGGDIGTFVGALVGIWPITYGALKNQIGFGILAFICTTFMGTVGGLLLSVPVAATFVWKMKYPVNKNNWLVYNQ